jgi:hypothetical protein
MSVEKIKICGLFFCANSETEYVLNIHEKISKLSRKIRAWSHRHLTMEGKTLIVKTFGLSQLIYNLQSYTINQEEIVIIERIIFKFLWSNSILQNGVDRVKRSIMKNEHKFGGMNVTDVDCLDRALKLRQFIRASVSDHSIANIQSHLSGSKTLKNEYNKIKCLEPICERAFETVNILTDHNRLLSEKLSLEEYENDTILINDIASIHLDSTSKEKRRYLHHV